MDGRLNREGGAELISWRRLAAMATAAPSAGGDARGLCDAARRRLAKLAGLLDRYGAA